MWCRSIVICTIGGGRNLKQQQWKKKNRIIFTNYVLNLKKKCTLLSFEITQDFKSSRKIKKGLLDHSKKIFFFVKNLEKNKSF